MLLSAELGESELEINVSALDEYKGKSPLIDSLIEAIKATITT